MKTYNVSVVGTASVYYDAIVNAESEAEALEKAIDEAQSMQVWDVEDVENLDIHSRIMDGTDLKLAIEY